ncbi:putative GNAT family N-acetyltransferase domain protein [Candidatus Cyrtobacter comes]|uniref:GNAT family N-acetyltransferase domain protein n=1 Tax=Candidatus Cyrtobacter comes TaxID=675776 RepID=A0ABU5L6R6_9RICK|nr:hypothetical protein [Candidatus Cyrtobacter comes]MDZ5761813.1 putative GNAT family N-acetyltransferase domain protein [Candidatus Cyrtobacter comes]
MRISKIKTGSRFFALIERWLKSLGIKSIHAESRKNSLTFYLKNGYTEMLFNDPDGHESDPNDVFEHFIYNCHNTS